MYLIEILLISKAEIKSIITNNNKTPCITKKFFVLNNFIFSILLLNINYFAVPIHARSLSAHRACEVLP